MATDELPVPDYDHLTTDALTHRIRSLEADDVQRLLDHETAHGNRLPVRTVLEARLQQLAEGAQPSGGDPAATANDQAAEAPGGTGPVDPSTSGPPITPEPLGGPTNPAQPRR